MDSDKLNLCMNCMQTVDEGTEICPHCGEPVALFRDEIYLPAGTCIHDRYITGRILYEYGDGVTYLGYDREEKRTVEIRELLLPSIVKRNAETNALRVKKTDVTLFTESYKSFLLMWRTLMSLKSPCVPKIYEVLPNTNVTCYVIMEHRECKPLSAYIKEHATEYGALTWEETAELFAPLVSAVDKLNGAGFVCRCISPDSIFIDSDKKLIPKGFCISDLCNIKSLLPPYVADGYAPIEQYGFDYNQGTHTDVYSLSCCIYTALTGIVPQDAQSRYKDDQLMIQQEVVDALEPHVIATLFDGLFVLPDERLQSCTQLFAQLRMRVKPSSDKDVERTDRMRNAFDKTFHQGIFDDEADEAETKHKKKRKEKEAAEKKPKKQHTVLAAVVAFLLTLILCCASYGVLYPLVLYKVEGFKSPILDEVYASLDLSFLSGNLDTTDTQTEESTEEEGSEGSTEQTTESTTESKPSEVILPDVVGKSYKAAKKELTALGFRVEKQVAPNDGSHTKDEVSDMSNVAELAYDYGILITLTVWG